MCLVGASYTEVYDTLSDLLGDVTDDERSLILGGNAVVAYALAI